MKFTELEIKILEAARDNDYDDVVAGGSAWTDAVIDQSGLSGEIARGVISSLIKKGVAVVAEYDGKGDTVFSINPDKLSVVQAALTPAEPPAKTVKHRVSPKSLANLSKSPRTGRKPQYEQSKKRAEISLTPEAKERMKRGNEANNPIIQAGYASVSEFVELALRGEIEIPPYPKSDVA